MTLEAEHNPELVDMTQRFWVGVILTVPLFVMAMGEMVGLSFDWLGSNRTLGWLQLALATPAVLWGGWPFFSRAWQSLVHRSLNMFTLVGLGTGVAYGYSLIAIAAPGLFPASFQTAQG